MAQAITFRAFGAGDCKFHKPPEVKDEGERLTSVSPYRKKAGTPLRRSCSFPFLADECSWSFVTKSDSASRAVAPSHHLICIELPQRMPACFIGVDARGSGQW